MKLTTLSALFALASPLALGAQEVEPPRQVEQAPAAKKQDKEPKVYEVGTKVPAKLAMMDINGKKMTMKQLRGKNVILVWYAKDCPAIKSAGKRLASMAKEVKNHKDVVMIAVNSDKKDLADAEPTGMDAEGKPIKPFVKLRKHVDDKNAQFTMVVDRGGVMARKFKAKTTPHVFVIDGEGVVRYSGALDNDPRGNKKEGYTNYALAAVKELKQGKPVTVKSTKPYG